jgi:type VI secretion system protein ImpJ
VEKRIREKANYLIEQEASRPPDTLRRAQIQSLVAGLPVFQATLATDRAHPYALYLALCAMAGNIAGVGDEFELPDLKPYDHNHPLVAFEEVRQYLIRKLAGISEKWLRFKLHRQEKRFTLAASADWLKYFSDPDTGAVFLGIRGDSGVSEERLEDWGRNCLIGTRNMIPSLISDRILGALRERVERLEHPLPARGITLFALTPDLEFIRQGEDLLVFDRRVDALVPADVSLYVLPNG